MFNNIDQQNIPNTFFGLFRGLINSYKSWIHFCWKGRIQADWIVLNYALMQNNKTKYSAINLHFINLYYCTCVLACDEMNWFQCILRKKFTISCIYNSMYVIKKHNLQIAHVNRTFFRNRFAAYNLHCSKNKTNITIGPYISYR